MRTALHQSPASTVAERSPLTTICYGLDPARAAATLPSQPGRPAYGVPSGCRPPAYHPHVSHFSLCTARASKQLEQLLSLLQLERVLVARAAGVQTERCWSLPLRIDVRSGGL